VIDRVMECRFEQAVACADSLEQREPHAPLWPLMRLVALGVRDIDFDCNVDSAAFIRAYQQTMLAISQSEKTGGRTSATVTLGGLAKATYAAFFLRQQQYWTGIQEGFEALGMLKEARAIDSTNVDASLIGGVYEYAKGELKKKFWWVLFWYPGSRERGIRIIDNCRIHGQITAAAAEVVLAEIYLLEKNYESARSLTTRLAGRYPGSRFVLWAEAKYSEARAEWSAAADTYGKLSKSYEAHRHGEYNSLVTGAAQCRALMQAGAEEHAREIGRRILEKCSLRKDQRFDTIAKEVKKTLEKGEKNGGD
jgi:hypothetical protein